MVNTPCIFIGQKRNMHQRYLTAWYTELTARTSSGWPTGVSKCDSHACTILCAWRTSCVSKFEGTFQTQVVQVSFLDLRNLLWTVSLLLKCWARPRAVLSAFVCDGKSVLLWKFGFYCECYVCIASVERYPNHFIVYVIIYANLCCVCSARWWSVMWILFDKTLYKHNLAVTFETETTIL